MDNLEAKSHIINNNEDTQGDLAQIAEKLYAEKDYEKALKMYQVAMGLIREPDVISQLEKKIASLEKLQASSNSSSRSAADQRKSAEPTVGKASESSKIPQSGQASLKRDIVPASPKVEARVETENSKWPSVAPVIENIQEIEKLRPWRRH